MSQIKAEKSFDCLAYKQRVQQVVYEEIKDLPFDEQRAYFERRAEQGPLGEWWKRMKAATRSRGDEPA